MRTVSQTRLAELVTISEINLRGRINHNLHPTPDDPVQRLFNVLRRGSYVRPHRHVDPHKWELFVILAGRAAVLELAADGTVLERCELDPGTGGVAVEIDGGRWHTVAATAATVVLFEVKPGPYIPIDDKDFASWAPPEGSPGCDELVRWFETAGPGSRPPDLG